ncbi:MAG: 2-amino-4-hydroxy-6-hydroxymethyldihydropteridine diphosphokinase [Lentimicrobium sp.]|jgi:2-amino-4-hydroxy-6-hydroxymethyldihydropteridine diphosphokinase|nr:2-amino-4-hydroxy-6-hydroxymethyldihydropteridine diphosphokinase [Lentimicrobium sp.]MDD2526450.1 2-amino-4-hydroxy-6-hydroxymethyldihydropteridine diphosphokinase [Lentimicrobiaceae bacterium]MDD4596415.1 2-amino-4-hydroxy-6-hydroxymethyldihydropteridine diphosphokinase [Lentimicrobiaceae bacterium]MDY0026500.1 2-amino-4-hydroxy-6-hydroxymethyldihydropteridine diphosphokinase [Lentimicrobium sp.]
MKNEVYLLLGSNLGNRQEYLYLARKALSHIVGDIIQASGVFETEAWGTSADEKLYLNQAVLLSTNHSPATLIRQTLKIERYLGRQRSEQQYAARTIDIDIIFFNQMILNTASLTLPHPRMQLRRFVLEPLNEIAAGFVHPGLHINVNLLLQACDDQLNVKRISDTYNTGQPDNNKTGLVA